MEAEKVKCLIIGSGPAGYTAAIYAALEVAKKLGTGKKVLALAPDNGERYLSTALYNFEI